MNPDPHSRRSRYIGLFVWTILGAITAGWTVFLFFQHGNIWDESEHAHVAWLISLGKKPLDDFFQHHQPLLWSLLALYYRVGFKGAGVFLWGRILVVLSGLSSVAALLAIGRSNPKISRLPECLGTAIFIGINFSVPELFVIRPETISTAFFLLALVLWNKVLWNKEGGATQATIAGALAGAAVYSSPRFALLAGLFFLIGNSTARRWLFLAAGGFLFVGLYTVASGFGPEKVLFNLRFSSYLQSVGNYECGPPALFWASLILIACLPLAALMFGMPKSDRWRAAALIVHAVIVFSVCTHFAGMFRYSQAYAPAIIAVAVAGAWIGGRLEVPAQPAGSVIAAVLLFGFLQFSFLLRPAGTPLDIFAIVHSRDRLAAMVPSGETVLLFSGTSPITIEDASYYGRPLEDGQNRLCRAIRGFRSRIQFPKCDFLETLQNNHPYLTEAPIEIAVSAPDKDKVAHFLKENYSSVDLGSDFPANTRIVKRVRSELHVSSNSSPQPQAQTFPK